MKKLNVFIEDTACRSQAMNLPFHYARANCNIYMLKPGEFKDSRDWSKTTIWPRLLFKPSANSSERNLSNYRLNEDDILYGEDYFLINERDEILATTYKDNAHVTLVSENELKTLGKEIDVFHTSEFCKNNLNKLLSWGNHWLPNAKWISSCVDPGDVNKGHPGPKQPDNICLVAPSPCENMFDNSGKNVVLMFRNKFELELIGANKNLERNQNVISSFMHNFHVRDPGYYKLFCELKEYVGKLGIEITNYGGNIRGHGADLRYNKGGKEGKGPSGSNFETLSIRKSIEKYYSSRAILHLKGLDWAGGVPAHSQMTGTPLITILPFLQASNYLKSYNQSTGTIICNSTQEILEAIVAIVNNEQLFKDLSTKMLNLEETFFSKSYWEKWVYFVNNLK